MTIKAFTISDRMLAAARERLPSHLHEIDGKHVISEAAATLLGTTLGELRPHTLDVNRWDATDSRLHRKWAAAVSDPLPDDVAVEARLMLYADAALELEFMGRGKIGSDAHIPGRKELLLTLDRPGGKRLYLFRRLDAPAGGSDARMETIDARYAEVSRWMRDPDARLVLSLGGGGFRLFAAIPVLKAIDQIAGRDRIDEVWGSSGGSFLGFAYAAGFPVEALDQFAFDLYNGRVPRLSNGSFTHIMRSRVLAALDDLRGRERPHDMVDWLLELEQRHPPIARKPSRPFYAIASSTDRAGLTALAAPAHYTPSCSDFMVACDPHAAVAASTAVPFVLRPVRGIGDRPGESWFDGSISDENPLALAYLKWLRERAANPAGTPSRLKIVLVNLNLRARESSLLRALDGLPVMRQLGFVGKGSRVVDMLLDSKTTTNIRLLTAMPGVEILSVKLKLGWLNAQGPREIAKAMRSGRSLETWDIAIHRAAG